jgi:hypothetical protein
VTWLVQMLLPVAGRQKAYEDVLHQLTERFGGATAYTRAPAAGLWKNPSEGTERDDIIVVEVMVDSVDRAWWGAFRRRLEKRLRQKEIVVRAHEIRTL